MTISFGMVTLKVDSYALAFIKSKGIKRTTRHGSILIFFLINKYLPSILIKETLS
jgi:hypothetical protein